jgi:AcrR family transcriptional regulator
VAQETRIDGRRVRGDLTRSTVLVPAVALATVKGLEGFSLGDLSLATGVSKAGIVAVFGNKQQLQQAITDHARTVLFERVFAPTMAAKPGLSRLITLGRVWLNYLADPALEGGCFFAAAMFELDAQPGPLRETLRADMNQWITAIASTITDGQADGDFDSTADPIDDAVDFFSIGITTNALIQLNATKRPADRGRRLWARHIDALRITAIAPATIAPATIAPTKRKKRTK